MNAPPRPPLFLRLDAISLAILAVAIVEITPEFLYHADVPISRVSETCPTDLLLFHGRVNPAQVRWEITV